MNYYCMMDPKYYSRGAGYAWQPTDFFADLGMKSRCERDNGMGNCEKHGLIYYPKCKPGYLPQGCCMCKTTKPDCQALGLDIEIFEYSCKMKVQATNDIATAPSLCAEDEILRDGLCYKVMGC
jgi:hypothetical protein